MAWSVESVREASLTPADVFRHYADPTTWGSWGHNTRWARADGPVVEGATVHVKAGYGTVYPVLIRRMVIDRYIECEVRPPGMVVVNTYEVQPISVGVRIRHTIEVSGRLAGVTKLIPMDKLYRRLLAKETRRLVDVATRTRDMQREVGTGQAASVGSIRLATLQDAEAIDRLMKESIRDIFPRFYDEKQTASSIVHVSSVDRKLIEDGTYFVIVEADEIIACGGWSRRDKLYTGSGAGTTDARPLNPQTEPARVRAMFVRSDWTRRGLGTRILEACEEAARAEGFHTLALMATLPGLLLYERYGFVATEQTTITLPDGTSLATAAMEKPVSSRSLTPQRMTEHPHKADDPWPTRT